jgi:hypothetical protein
MAFGSPPMLNRSARPPASHSAKTPCPDLCGSRGNLFGSHTGPGVRLALPLMEFQVVESETASEPG